MNPFTLISSCLTHVRPPDPSCLIAMPKRLSYRAHDLRKIEGRLRSLRPLIPLKAARRLFKFYLDLHYKFSSRRYYKKDRARFLRKLRADSTSSQIGAVVLPNASRSLLKVNQIDAGIAVRMMEDQGVSLPPCPLPTCPLPTRPFPALPICPRPICARPICPSHTCHHIRTCRP